MKLLTSHPFCWYEMNQNLFYLKFSLTNSVREQLLLWKHYPIQLNCTDNS